MSVHRDHVCSTTRGNETLTWKIPRLWEEARDLLVNYIPVADVLPILKETYCFGSAPTCWDMARHAKQVYEADLNYPIILNADGDLMDGSHRIAKAWMLGLETIRAVRFIQDPEPDERGESSDMAPPPSLPSAETLTPNLMACHSERGEPTNEVEES